MKFEWDENKNAENIRNHGIPFEMAKRIFEGFTVDQVDDRFEYGETREISIGMCDGVSILVVVHTDRNDVCRLISARPALKKERRLYDAEIQKALER